MVLQPFFPLLILILSVHVVTAFPQVDFERMGNVGLAGAFAGLDIFRNASVSFDSTTSTLLSRSSDGFLTRVASTNVGGTILAGCTLGDTFYLAGSFNSIDGVPATNVASYTPSSASFASLGSNSPNGPVNALFCDSTQQRVWVGGSFSFPGSAVAIYNPNTTSWSSPPFGGVAGLQAKVTSITTNSSDTTLFFAGSFLTSFGNGDAVLNGTNNPDVPFSEGASPFSSALVPIPLGNAQVDASPSSNTAGFSNINNTLCPVGPDGSGNSWLASDGSKPFITIRTFSFISASGIRLGNTFQAGHGTTGFRLTTIPDNNVITLKYVDPATGQNQTCMDPCPLSTDPTILYQDFLFDGPIDITGVQIAISNFTGSSAGLHILQLLSSGAFASSINANNGLSCYAPIASNSTETGQWTAKIANTNIAGTVQTVLVSTVGVGTAASFGPSFTWIPYISASGYYDVNLLVPGCTDFQDCALRTSVQVTLFPGAGSVPFVTTISQQNQEDATIPIYSGPIYPSSPNFVTTITMTLANSPVGSGQNGQYELVADRVQLVLNSANITLSGSSNATSAALGLARGVGFLEWPRSFPSTNATAGILPNSTLTTSDFLGFDILSSIGGMDTIDGLSSTLFSINAVAHHGSGTIFVGGAFNLTSGSAAGTSNLVSFRNGGLVSLANDGLDGQVTSLVLVGDQLYVGGSFQDTSSGSTQNKLGGIALYDVQKNSWSPLDAGVNGAVTSIGLSNNQIQIAGNFTKLITGNGSGINAPGFGVWDIKTGAWVNGGGFVVGNMTFVGNETSSTQLLAGNVVASQKYGATGLVMLKNGDSSGPKITPLSVDLVDSQVSMPNSLRRRANMLGAAWISHIKFSRLFSRQTNKQASLSPPLPASAPAVLAGAFWSNSSNDLTILGGNFSFVAPGTSTTSTAVAIYDPGSASIQGLLGSQINGTVRALLVDGNLLYVGGEFTIPGATVNGLALYNLLNQEWDLNGLQSLQPIPGSAVVVRSISQSTSMPTTLVVAGSFSQAGSLQCQAICSFDTVTKQWNALGSGIQGEVTSVAYAGTDQSILIAAGSISLSDNTPANVVQYTFNNATWTSVGAGSDIPGPISAIEVNSGNASSLFAAGTSSDGSSSFLSFWNGIKWATLGSTFEEGTTVAQMTMVPLQDTHPANPIIESDRVLMISGSLTTSTGNASSALFDGQNIIPYIVSSLSTGTPGSVSSLFHSLSSFSFDQKHFLATGVVILISIAIGAGFVFFLALVGILWTLFSRKDEKLSKLDSTNDDDDDSTNHRPSSLLEHINAATRTTILGAGADTQNTENGEEEKVTGYADPFGPDASNYMRADTPSDAVGGMLAEETSRLAHARYSFDGTGEGELPISAGAEVEVLDDRDPAWWYARDARTGQEGVVPAAYLY